MRITVRVYCLVQPAGTYVFIQKNISIFPPKLLRSASSLMSFALISAQETHIFFPFHQCQAYFYYQDLIGFFMLQSL